LRLHRDPARPAKSLTLPPLHGQALAWFRAIWIASLALALTAVAIGQVRDYRTHIERPFSRLGLGWSAEGGEIRLTQPLTQEARGSGVVKGMTIVAVDGHPVGPTVESRADIESRLKGPEGSKVSLTLRGADGRLSSHRLTRTVAHFDEPLAGTGLSGDQDIVTEMALKGLADLFLLGASILLFRAARRSTLAACFSLCFVLFVAVGPETWQFWLPRSLSYLQRALGFVAEACLAIGLFAFPHGRFDRRWTAWAAGAATLIAAIDAAFPGWSGNAGLLIGIATFGGAVAAGVQRYRRAGDDAGRQQMRWALFGFGWATVLFFLSSGLWVLLATTPPNSPLWLWGQLVARLLQSLGIGCLTGGLLVSVLRYRLYDVDALLSRSTAYGILTLAFVALFAGLEKAIEILGEHWFEGSAAAAVAGGIAAGIAALLIVPLHNRIHRWAERRFQKRLLRLKGDVAAALEELRETGSPEEVAVEVTGLVARAVRAEHAALVIGGETRAQINGSPDVVAIWLETAPRLSDGAAGLSCDPDDPIFPVRARLGGEAADAAPPAWLLLGPRPDGSFYGRDEQEAVAGVGPPIAAALRSAARRAAREAALEARLGKIESAVAALAGAARATAAAAE
jgi:hypothetical protein